MVLSADIARVIGIKPGDPLTIELQDGRLVLRSYLSIVAGGQARFRALLPPDFQGSSVDELIADRRADAAREEAEIQVWRQDYRSNGYSPSSPA